MMTNKIQDIVPLEVTNFIVSDVIDENKIQSVKSISGKVLRRQSQSVPTISLISGNEDDAIRRNYEVQGNT